MAIANVFVRAKTTPGTYIIEGGTSDVGFYSASKNEWINVLPPDKKSYFTAFQKGTVYVVGTTSPNPGDSFRVPTTEVVFSTGGSPGTAVVLRKV